MAKRQMSGIAHERAVAFEAPAVADTLAQQVFGVRSVDSEPEAVRAIVMKGVAPTKLDYVGEVYDLSQTDMAKLLGVNPRTLARKTRTKALLPVSVSDATARMVRVFDRASEVLGARAKASEWLAAPNTALGGDAPRAWLDSDVGASEVLRVLGRLEHGVFS